MIMCSSLHFTCRTYIVGHSEQSVGEIKKCIDNWIISGKATGQFLTLGGSNLTVSLLALFSNIIKCVPSIDHDQVINFEEPELPMVLQSLPVWVWIVVIVGAMLLVVCFVTAIILVVVVSRRKR